MSKHLEFYQLDRSPFEDGVRDAAAVGTRPLRAALERTRRFIETETCVVCVKGRPGVGKTYLGLALPSVLPDTLIARIGHLDQPWSAIHASIARGFDRDPHSFSVDTLRELRNTGRRLVIEIDPVEQLQPESFAPLLSLLSHAYLPERRLVQAVLIGDLAALPEVARQGLIRLGSATLELEPLPEGDVPSYIQKRLDRAGYRGQPLFSRAASEDVCRRAGGLPREINRICTRALEIAAAQRLQIIEPELIREACAAAPTETAAPAASTPRAVIGQLKLETRSVEPVATAVPSVPVVPGQPRRIEPLPPEPVVEAELETPLMEAEFLDEVPARPAPPRAPEPTRAPVREPARAVARAPRPAPVAAGPAPSALIERVRPAPPARTPEPAIEVRRDEPAPASAQAAPGVAAPVVQSAAALATSAPAETSAGARAGRRFPWIHVGASLAAAWLIAAGVFWFHTPAIVPEPSGVVVAISPAPDEAAPPFHPEPSPVSERAIPPAPSAELLTGAQTVAPETPTPARSAAVEVVPAAPPTPRMVAPEPAPEPAIAAPTAPPVPPAALALDPAPAAASTAAKPPRTTVAPTPQPPVRVELRSRGRDVLYPPRPASAYLTPAQ